MRVFEECYEQTFINLNITERWNRMEGRASRDVAAQRMNTSELFIIGRFLLVLVSVVHCPAPAQPQPGLISRQWLMGQVLSVDRSLWSNGLLEGLKGMSPARGAVIQLMWRPRLFLVLEKVGIATVPYRLCWRSLGARAHRTWSRRGNRRWRGSEEGGSLVAHSPAVEANRRDSLAFHFHDKATEQMTPRFPRWHRSVEFLGERAWKGSKSRAKGSDVIHARMRCLYMQLSGSYLCRVCRTATALM